MSLPAVEAVWFKRLTNADFFNIEKMPGATQGGGGMLYIDIPKSARDPLFRFLHNEPPGDPGPFPRLEVTARAVGAPTMTGDLEFEVNRENDPRYRIKNQNPNFAGGSRHPAWRPALGFPEADDGIDSAASAGALLPEHTTIFLVRTDGGEHFAGFAVGTEPPEGWPTELAGIFTEKWGLIETPPSPIPELDTAARQVLEAWDRGRVNVLLFGPPGTGKTRAINQLWRLLQPGAGGLGIHLDATSVECPFVKLKVPSKAVTDWVTFHQNFTYEDFIVGLRPKPEDGGLTLRARAGRLLDLLVERELGGADTAAVMFIDEINRGNVPRILGEFITFMDSDYRDTNADGTTNEYRLPVPFPSLSTDGAFTEIVERPLGGSVRLPIPWYFPRRVFTVATMNSVDRAVAPLDSAIGRRFERVEVMPDLEFAARWLGVDEDEIRIKLTAAVAPAESELTPVEAGWLLLYRLNHEIATRLGREFELGHSYLLPLRDRVGGDATRALAEIWDFGILPQLQDRFASRPHDLAQVLHVGSDFAMPDGLLIGRRQLMFDSGTEDLSATAVEHQPLSRRVADDPDAVLRTLRYLAEPQA